MKQKVTLVFPNLHLLWAFAQHIQSPVVELIPAECRLICECVAADLELARQKFGARIVEDLPKEG